MFLESGLSRGLERSMTSEKDTSRVRAKLVIRNGDNTAIFYLLGKEDDDSRNESTTLTVSVGSRDCGDSDTARVDVDDDDRQSSLVDQVLVFSGRLSVFPV